MRFTLTIKCDNEAFHDERGGDEDEDAVRQEVGRILTHLGCSMRQEGVSGHLMDANGNTVGSWQFAGK